MSDTGRLIEIRVNGALVAMLQTERAVAADYLNFINGVTEVLLRDRAALEAEANKSGRTINGHKFSGIGSVDISGVAHEER